MALQPPALSSPASPEEHPLVPRLPPLLVLESEDLATRPLPLAKLMQQLPLQAATRAPLAPARTWQQRRWLA